MKKIISIVIAAAIAFAAAAAVFLILCPREKPLPDRITIYMKDSGRIITEDYRDFIVGCVFGWMSPACGREAIKSAACALNTLALYRMGARSGFENNGADITAEECGEFPFMTEEQITEEYGSSAPRYLEKVRECTEQAVNYAITYGGEPICAVMCRISSGRTDSGSFPCLAGASAQCDETADGYESTAALTPLEVRKALCNAMGEYAAGSISLVGNGENWFSKAEYADSGTLTSICFGGAKINGELLKNSLELRSAAITVSFTEDKFLFTCHGWGDNLGMSLSCAQTFALQGMKMTDILAYFYSGTELTVL